MQRHLTGAWSVSFRIVGPGNFFYKIHDAQNRMRFEAQASSKKSAFQSLRDQCHDELDGDDLVKALLAIAEYLKAHP